MKSFDSCLLFRFLVTTLWAAKTSAGTEETITIGAQLLAACHDISPRAIPGLGATKSYIEAE